MKKTLRPAAFLDRDGTINVDKGYLHRIEDFDYLDGAAEGMRKLQDLGYALVVITNQSGIARGYYTEDDYRRLTAWMLADLSEKGIHIEGVYHCPHHPEGKVGQYARGCNCRKPKTGLFYQAADELGIDLGKSIAVGDKMRDLEICRETGAKGILLSGNGKAAAGAVPCRNWVEVARSAEKMRKKYPGGCGLWQS